MDLVVSSGREHVCCLQPWTLYRNGIIRYVGFETDPGLFLISGFHHQVCCLSILFCFRYPLSSKESVFLPWFSKSFILIII